MAPTCAPHDEHVGAAVYDVTDGEGVYGEVLRDEVRWGRVAYSVLRELTNTRYYVFTQHVIRNTFT